MSDILKRTHEKVLQKETSGPKTPQKDISAALQKKFGKTSNAGPG
jgi:hypothetical protein